MEIRGSICSFSEKQASWWDYFLFKFCSYFSGGGNKILMNILLLPLFIKQLLHCWLRSDHVSFLKIFTTKLLDFTKCHVYINELKKKKKKKDFSIWAPATKRFTLSITKVFVFIKCLYTKRLNWRVFTLLFWRWVEFHSSDIINSSKCCWFKRNWRHTISKKCTYTSVTMHSFVIGIHIAYLLHICL